MMAGLAVEGSSVSSASVDRRIRLSKVLMWVGWAAFAMAVLFLLPGVPHKNSLFRIAGCFILVGWALQRREEGLFPFKARIRER